MPCLRIPAKIENLTEVNDFIHEQLPEGYESLVMQVQLAAEELLVNVFSYAYADTPGATEEATVTCRMVHFDGQDFFCFSVQDWGMRFNPFVEAAEPDITLGVDERPIGGLGIFLIKTMVAHYSYSYHGDANVTELLFAMPEVGK